MRVDEVFRLRREEKKCALSFEMFPPKGELTLERASGAVLLSADVSGSVVKARLSAEDTARLSLRPSSEVFLSFSYSSLRWL